jgi:hypothetical protein
MSFAFIGRSSWLFKGFCLGRTAGGIRGTTLDKVAYKFLKFGM